MFHEDKPIQNYKDDVLNRFQFAQKIARAIKTISNNQSFVFALIGPWGSGKTSILNLVSNTIEEKDESSPLIGNYITVRFNPWNNIEQQSLTEEFFNTITEELKERANIPSSHKDNILNICKLIDDYTIALQASQLKAVLRTSNNIFLRKTKKETSSISALKEKIAKTLINYDLQLLIVIDDIDRLNNKKICELFQLIATVGHFPSVNYLLSFDRNIVERAVSEIHNCNGSEYLEKIIQIQLEVPQLNKDSLMKLLDDYFSGVIEFPKIDQSTTQENFNEQYLITSKRLIDIKSLVLKSLRSMRDFKKYINSVNFELLSWKGQVDTLDLALIALLKYICPQGMDIIWSQKSNLCQKGNYSDSLSDSRSKNIDLINNEVKMYLEENSDEYYLVTEILQEIFIEPIEDEVNTLGSLTYAKRLASSEIMKQYLTAELTNSGSILDTTHDLIVHQQNDKLKDLIANSILVNNLGLITDSIMCFKNSINENTSRMLIEEFMNVISKAENETLYTSENATITSFIEELLNNLEVNEASIIIEKTYENIEAMSKIALAEFITRRERAFERNGYTGHNYKELISLEALEAIEKMFIESMKEIASSDDLFKINGPYISLILWKQIDSHNFKKMLDSMKKQLNYIYILAFSFISTWSPITSNSLSASPSGWMVIDEIKKYTELNRIIEAIENIAYSHNLLKFSNETQSKIAALYLAIKTNRFGIDTGMIRPDEVKKQIDDWSKKNGKN